MPLYDGQCHCGAVKFSFNSEPITSAMRCTCSICRRKNALMSDCYFEPDAFVRLKGEEHLTLYRWGDCDVNHYFCSHCGIYTFHDGVGSEGRYRVNLGCIDDLDAHELALRVYDGKNLL